MPDSTVTLPAIDLLQFLCDLGHGLNFLSQKLKTTAHIAKTTSTLIDSHQIDDTFPSVDSRMNQIIETIELTSTRLNVWTTSIHNCKHWIVKSQSESTESLQIPYLPTGFHRWQWANVINDYPVFLPLRPDQSHHPEYTPTDVVNRSAFYWQRQQIHADSPMHPQEHSPSPPSPAQSTEYNDTDSESDSHVNHYDTVRKPLTADSGGPHAPVLGDQVVQARQEAIEARPQKQREPQARTPTSLAPSSSVGHPSLMKMAHTTDCDSLSPASTRPLKRQRRHSHDPGPRRLRRHETLLLPDA